MRTEELSRTERRLWTAFAQGTLLDLRADPDDGAGQADTWGEEREVRAEAIASMLVDPAAGKPGAVARLRLAGARITGALDLSFARIEHPIAFEQCVFDAAVIAHEASTRSIRFTGCRLPGVDANRFELRGELELTGCHLQSVSLYASRIDEIEVSGSHIRNPGKTALNWDLLTVNGAVYCQDAQIDGTVRMPGTKIEGHLQLSGARITSESGPAIHAWGLTVGNGMFCGTGFGEERNPFRVTGEVDLSNAQIRGPLMLDHAHLSNPGGAAFIGDQLRVDGALFLRDLTAHGEIRLRAARISALLSLASSTLVNPSGIALHADRMVVDAGAYLHSSFRAEGTLRLVGAEVHGDLHLDTEAVDGTVDLRRAYPRTLRTSGAGAARVRLNGLRYDGLEPALPAAERLAWLASDADGYQPQPYEQLAAQFRRIGQEESARRVLLAKQRRRRSRLGPLGKAWGYIQDWLIGYGYRPWLAIAWLLGLLAIGTWFFSVHPPTEDTEFGPFAYTLDLLLPVISLGQESAWTPGGGSALVAYLLILAGWILATVAAAGVTRVLSRT